MTKVRIRQLVFVSENIEDITTLQTVLGLGEPFVDPGVGEFGLTNGVFAFGDQFLEVVVPTEPNTAAGRFMDRSDGTGGYMAIFQTDNLGAVRARADAAEIRRVWNVDLPDILASHMHPADLGACIVSIDEPMPPESWRWGGPNWVERSAPGTVIGAHLTSPDPEHLAQKWASLLDLNPVRQGDVWYIPMQDGDISVRPGDREQLSSFELRLSDAQAVIERARSAGLDTYSMGFHTMGVDVSLTAE